jgi:hypothetical protein
MWRLRSYSENCRLDGILPHNRESLVAGLPIVLTTTVEKISSQVENVEDGKYQVGLFVLPETSGRSPLAHKADGKIFGSLVVAA